MANIFSFFRRNKQIKQEKQLQSVDDRGWTRIFDWRPGAFQQHTPYDTEESVLSHPTLFACETLIQGDIGKLRPTVQQKNGDIWKEQQNKTSQLLMKPNNYQNHILFKQHWLNSKLNHGNTYVLKERDSRRRIVALHILDPLKVTPLVAENGDVFYRLSQERLAKIPTDDELQNTVPAIEIIHDRFNCLYHPLIGLSPIFAAGVSGQLGIKIMNDSKNFFANGANPGGILSAPGTISESTAKRLKEYWQENFTGKKSGEIAVAGDGLKYEPMRMSSVDAQLLDQLNWSDEKICATFHVPSYMAGVGEMPQSTNSETFLIQYYTQCLQVLIEAMEVSLDDGLDLPSNQRTQLDLDGLFRMDQSTLSKIIETYTKSGTMAPDEGRAKLNLGPVPGGKYPYLQQQNFSLEALARRDSQEDPFTTSEPPSNDQDPANDDEEDLEALQLAASVIALGKPYKNRFKAYT